MQTEIKKSTRKAHYPPEADAHANRKCKSCRKKGFTLIEILIVVAIIGTLAGVSLVSLNSSRSAAYLNAAQREVSSAIKLAQSHALQGRAQSGVTPCGYGVRFSDTKNYEIFYNPPPGGSNCTTMNGTDTYRQYDPSISADMESQQLNNKVTISGSDSGEEIYFTVPHGNVFDETGNSYTLDKTFTFNSGSLQKTITITPGGTITEN